MKTFFRGIFTLIIVVTGGFYSMPTTYAQATIPKTSEIFKKDSGIFKNSNIKDYTADDTDKDGAAQFRIAVMKLVGFLKKLMGPIAILLLVYGGVELYLAHGSEEEYKKTISQIAGIGTGFLLMFVAVNLVDWIFFGKSGEIFRGDADSTEFAKRGMQEVVGIFDYLTIFAVILAIAFIVWNAITLIIAGGEDESQISDIKKKIIYSIVGIIIMVSIKPMIAIISDADGGLVIPNIFGGISIVAKWVNFILGLIGVFAVIAIIYAGIRLVINFGDEEATSEAKKIMTAAIIGLLISFSAWTIVQYFIAP
jgi:hypothetical protein